MISEIRELNDAELKVVTGGNAAETAGHLTAAMIVGLVETASAVASAVGTITKPITG